MCNLFLSFKASNLRSNLTLNKLKGTSLLTIVGDSIELKDYFFTILIEFDKDNKEFEDIGKILKSIAYQDYNGLI